MRRLAFLLTLLCLPLLCGQAHPGTGTDGAGFAGGGLTAPSFSIGVNVTPDTGPAPLTPNVTMYINYKKVPGKVTVRVDCTNDSSWEDEIYLTGAHRIGRTRFEVDLTGICTYTTTETMWVSVRGGLYSERNIWSETFTIAVDDDTAPAHTITSFTSTPSSCIEACSPTFSTTIAGGTGNSDYYWWRQHPRLR
jgi:hypothetical protein